MPVVPERHLQFVLFFHLRSVQQRVMSSSRGSNLVLGCLAFNGATGLAGKAKVKLKDNTNFIEGSSEPNRNGRVNCATTAACKTPQKHRQSHTWLIFIRVFICVLLIASLCLASFEQKRITNKMGVHFYV